MAENGRHQVPPRVVLTLGLADQTEVLSAAILASNCFRGAGAHAIWLPALRANSWY
ncbi:hypothetical protein [Cryobacterium roopkundense]|uniref:Uncharacterized protein n=1 Tax=Cryobacterium roopkundense TaxID=1001240 RepID=A0A7W9A047_9MICO|nr:hypothetical protein [Cryobacterium roopkundense]MBB5643414.1 hypothetical protein [Cryobacterium roopkundense]